MASERDTSAPSQGDEGAASAAEDAAAGVEIAVEPEGAPEAEDAAALRERLRSVEAQLELAQEKGRETFARLKEEHELRLRAAADLDNYRKRAQRERDEVQKFGSEKLLRDLVPVVDNLDRALSAAPAGDPMAKGVELVRKGLEEALAKHGVEVFSALGKPFDPRLHEALAHLDVPGAEPGSVVAEHGRGFLLQGRLLRPAMVAVAPPRAAAPEPPAPAPSEAPPPADEGTER
jgi:molecular chaperone GrpE